MNVVVTAHTTPVTSQLGDSLTHQVFDVHANPYNADGLLRTVCDQWIIPASMMAPIETPCPKCLATLTHPEPGTTAPVQRRRWWSSLRARTDVPGG
jgi:hypothetical protein